MAALSADSIAALALQGDTIAADAKAATAVWGGSLCMRDVNGKTNPNATGTGVLAGFATGGVPVTLPTGVPTRTHSIQRKCVFRTLALTGVTAANIGAPVFCPTDNLADMTLTYTANAHIVGRVIELEYDSNGAIANACFVELDENLAGANASLVYKNEDVSLYSSEVAGGTVRGVIYKCPPNRKAIVLAADYTVIQQGTYATSIKADLTKVVAAVRTSLIAAQLDVSGGGVGVDIPTAFVGLATPFVTLGNGDRLEASLVAVGALTTHANVQFTAQLIEYGFAN